MIKNVRTLKCCLGVVLTLLVAASLRAEGDLVALYRELHAAPELSFAEVKTAERLAEELDALGFEVTRDVGGHGIVALLRNGDGSTLLIRTDLDALPIREQTGLAYASKVETTDENGNAVAVMHACGHDVHMTVWVGTARHLAAQRERWQGTLVMIGQPAEERGAGAKAMLDAGLFERFPRPDYNLALHVSAELPSGTLGLRDGAIAANVDAVDIAVPGVGGHGAYPHKTRDPIVLGANIVTALQTLVSRNSDPLAPAVVTVGSFHSGTRHNIISNRADLQLTVRSFSDESRTQLLAGIKRVVAGQALAYGWPDELRPRVTVREHYTPSVWNDPDLVARLRVRWQALVGAEQIVTVPPTMGGEDFARYGRVEPRIPSVLFWLGAVDPVRHARATRENLPLPSLHSPRFAPAAASTIKTGVAAMTAAAEMLLDEKNE